MLAAVQVVAVRTVALGAVGAAVAVVFGVHL